MYISKFRDNFLSYFLLLYESFVDEKIIIIEMSGNL